MASVQTPYPGIEPGIVFPVEPVKPNREAWLNVLVGRLRPIFKDHDFALPEKLRMSCGFPSERAFAPKNRVIGECWYPIHSADETNEIFISPVLSNAITVASTVVHELCHAHLGPGFGHKAKFQKVAAKIGLVKPWKATVASPELIKTLEGLVPGDYPHAEMSNRQPEGGFKTKKTYLLKATCPKCDYTVRVTHKWADTGLPKCTACNELFVLSTPESDGEEPGE